MKMKNLIGGALAAMMAVSAAYVPDADAAFRASVRKRKCEAMIDTLDRQGLAATVVWNESSKKCEKTGITASARKAGRAAAKEARQDLKDERSQKISNWIADRGDRLSELFKSDRTTQAEIDKACIDFLKDELLALLSDGALGVEEFNLNDLEPYLEECKGGNPDTVRELCDKINNDIAQRRLIAALDAKNKKIEECEGEDGEDGEWNEETDSCREYSDIEKCMFKGDNYIWDTDNSECVDQGDEE